MAATPPSAEKVRLDKWLWAARFYKTRSLAADEIDKGRVKVNGQVAKASREPRIGDEIELRAGFDQRTLRVKGLSSVRGPAAQAALLYEETAASLLARAHAAEQRRIASEPSQSLSQGRPTKRDRRQLADWQRWSASADKG